MVKTINKDNRTCTCGHNFLRHVVKEHTSDEDRRKVKLLDRGCDVEGCGCKLYVGVSTTLRASQRAKGLEEIGLVAGLNDLRRQTEALEKRVIFLEDIFHRMQLKYSVEG